MKGATRDGLPGEIRQSLSLLALTAATAAVYLGLALLVVRLFG
jgi:hypothetical protein